MKTIYLQDKGLDLPKLPFDYENITKSTWII